MLQEFNSPRGHQQSLLPFFKQSIYTLNTLFSYSKIKLRNGNIIIIIRIYQISQRLYVALLGFLQFNIIRKIILIPLFRLQILFFTGVGNTLGKYHRIFCSHYTKTGLNDLTFNKKTYIIYMRGSSQCRDLRFLYRGIGLMSGKKVPLHFYTLPATVFPEYWQQMHHQPFVRYNHLLEKV